MTRPIPEALLKDIDKLEPLPVTAQALLAVERKSFPLATIRLSRQSVIKAQLLQGTKVVGTARVTKNAGTHVVKVSLTKKARRAFQRQGRKRVTLTLKVVVVGNNKATKVFRYRVVVRI